MTLCLCVTLECEFASWGLRSMVNMTVRLVCWNVAFLLRCAWCGWFLVLAFLVCVGVAYDLRFCCVFSHVNEFDGSGDYILCLWVL